MKTETTFKRERTRIKDFDYSGSYIYFTTICTFGKQIYFNDKGIVNILIDCLRREATRFHFLIYAYCFMPDHLHLLLIGNEDSNLIKFIRIFKQKSGYYFKQHFRKQLWQKSFYDHILRKRESLHDIAGYIFENPIRKKLVDDFRKYPYLGSFVFNLNEFYNLYGQRRSIDIRSVLSK